MNNYFKIFSITAGIQLGGFILMLFSDRMQSVSESSTIIPVYIGGFFVLLSMILGIILPVKWCNTKRGKIITILLLPTNYTWLLIAIAVIKFVSDMLNILENIPTNFG